MSYGLIGSIEESPLVHDESKVAIRAPSQHGRGHIPPLLLSCVE
ncbi:MAG: hypothetical protein ACI835_000045 [Planctomycetota bacterium]|jgi:hypothetical protein